VRKILETIWSLHVRVASVTFCTPLTQRKAVLPCARNLQKVPRTVEVGNSGVSRIVPDQQQLERILESGSVRQKFPRLQVQTLDVKYVAEVSGHGSGLYVRIPKEIVDWFNIVAGDRIKVALLQRKAWKLEFEETVTESKTE